MLIITRREGESFSVGDDIQIVILQTGSQVRVGVIAPSEVEVLRTELIPNREVHPHRSV